MQKVLRLCVGLLLLCSSLLAQASAVAQHFEALTSSASEAKIQAIHAIAASADEQALTVLGSLLEGKLFVVEASGRFSVQRTMPKSACSRKARWKKLK
jgi:hypothetical protein